MAIKVVNGDESATTDIVARDVMDIGNNDKEPCTFVQTDAHTVSQLGHQKIVCGGDSANGYAQLHGSRIADAKQGDKQNFGLPVLPSIDVRVIIIGVERNLQHKKL